MATLRTVLLAASLVVGGTALAQAASNDVTGKWTYTVGANTSCTLTLVDGGTAQPGDKCPGGLTEVGHWSTRGSSIQLSSPSGSLVGILHADGDGYVGKQVEGGRKLALSR